MFVQFGLSQMVSSNFRDEFSAKMLSPIYRLNKTLLFIKKYRCSKTGIGKTMGIFVLLHYFVNYKWVSLNQVASSYLQIGCSRLNTWNTDSVIVAIFVLIHTASIRLNDLRLLKKEFPSDGSSTYCIKIEGSTKRSLQTKQGFAVKKNIEG